MVPVPNRCIGNSTVELCWIDPFEDGNGCRRMAQTEGEIALAHAIGRAFIELQQLEFCVVSFLNILSGGSADPGPSFDVFASKIFGNLVREMRAHPFLQRLADEMQPTKERRDHFIHRFLFHRYGGEHMTTDEEYRSLICDAHELGRTFRGAMTRFQDFMVDKSSIEMFAASVDPQNGEITIRRSKPIRAGDGEQGSSG